MVSGSDHEDLLRSRDGGEQQVSSFELFFDLVYVFAVTQLSHRLLGELTIGNALETLFLLLAVWWAWVYTAWVTNWFDPDRLPVRLMLIGVMLASLVMSVAIPDAFDERGLMFAVASTRRSGKACPLRGSRPPAALHRNHKRPQEEVDCSEPHYHL